MLDGRAMYMSALAPQLPNSPDDERIPLEFIVYAHQHVPNSAKKARVNEWELGRLINQLHLLGTLRLAALRDVKLLHNTGRQLSQLDLIMEEARESVATDESNVMALKIKNAHEYFNRITAGFNKNAGCSLAYRIDQSANYVGRFRSNVKFLRIKRLEGDQPYDQFVERRLSAEFDFIDRLGKRYERAANNISMLDQNYLSIETSIIDADTNRIDAGIRRIQEWGEFALLAALVPYYVTHLLAHFVQEKHLPIISIWLWAAFAATACYRKFNKKIYFRKVPMYYSKFNKPIYSGHVIAALIMIVVLVFVTVGWAGCYVFQRHPASS